MIANTIVTFALICFILVGQRSQPTPPTVLMCVLLLFCVCAFYFMEMIEA